MMDAISGEVRLGEMSRMLAGQQCHMVGDRAEKGQHLDRIASSSKSSDGNRFLTLLYSKSYGQLHGTYYIN